MAHKSRLAGFIIDCQGGDLDQAAAFWSKAVGMDVLASDDEDDAHYRVFDTRRDDLRLEVQKVSHASRVHLDIEADDIEAEVMRLIALGATEVSRPHDGRWVVMQAPTGHRFCVIRPKTRLTLANANRWD